MKKNKITNFTMIIITTLILTVNSIAISYIKPMKVQATEVILVPIAVDTIVKLLLATVATVSGLVIVDKAEECGVFDDLYKKYMTEGSSALKDMPDYDEDADFNGITINGKSCKIYDFVNWKSSGGGNWHNPNDEEFKKALKNYEFAVTAEFMKTIIDFMQENMKEDSPIDSVREYYITYGKQIETDTSKIIDNEVLDIDIDKFRYVGEGGLTYNGIANYITDENGICRVFKIGSDYSPTSTKWNKYTTLKLNSIPMYKSDFNNGLEPYNGGRICMFPDSPQSKPSVSTANHSGLKIYYQVNRPTEDNPNNISFVYVNGWDGEYGIINARKDGTRTTTVGELTDTTNIYPYADIPIFDNFNDGYEYISGIAPDASKAINIASSYTLPCDNLLMKSGELLDPLTGKDLNAGILPDIISETSKAIQNEVNPDPEPVPDPEPATQPQELPDDFPDIIGDIIETTMPDPIPLPDDEPIKIPMPDPIPTPDPIPIPEPDIDTDNQTIKDIANKTIGLDDLFPFCIPFDLINLINVLNVPAQAPYFEYPIKIEGVCDYVIIIDFAKYEGLAKIFRTFETLLFLLGLIMATRKLIKG